MTIRLVQTRWDEEMQNAVRSDTSALRIVSPFIKRTAIGRLLALGPAFVQVITRFSLRDFSKGVSDIDALRLLVAEGATVRGIRNLHAKLYLFGESRAILTSANLTPAALGRNHEFGMVADDTAVVSACQSYFEGLWSKGETDLSFNQIDSWDEIITQHRAAGGNPDADATLPDFGVAVGFGDAPHVSLPTPVADARQAFVKFLGKDDEREPLSLTTIDEISRAGCHWSVAYPKKKRPREVGEDALIFISRLTYDPKDIRIFGRAIGMKYEPGRDDATRADIELRPWKKDYPRYIRVHHAEFVAGTMENGVSLNELMDTLGSDAFATTQHHARRDEGNTNPRLAYRRRGHVKLSAEGLSWINERLQIALDRYGKVPQRELDELDWPELIAGRSEDSGG